MSRPDTSYGRKEWVGNTPHLLTPGKTPDSSDAWMAGMTMGEGGCSNGGYDVIGYRDNGEVNAHEYRCAR